MTPRLRLLTPIVPVVVLGGCTLVSGWSDLQDGKAPDASVQPDGSVRSSGDGGAGQDGSTPPTEAGTPTPSGSLRCGQQTCSRTEVCCMSAGATACASQSECFASGGTILQCTQRSDCASGQPCCLTSSAQFAMCLTGCGFDGESVELCSPADSSGCSSGKSCVAFPNVSGLWTCQ